MGFFKVEVQLIYNIVLVSGIQQSDSVTYFFILFSIIGYYKILNTVPFYIVNSYCLSILCIVVCYLLIPYA